MRIPFVFFFIIIVIVAILFGIRTFFRHASVITPTPSSTIKSSMQLTSPAFANNSSIPSKFTCDGENINPPLEISDVPQNTKSLFLIVGDPDAPGGTWYHWIVFNMSPTTKDIPENTVPQGVQGTTSWGKPGYGGPCPPSGTHHYHFQLYALDTELSLTSAAKTTEVEKAVQGHILAQSELIGLYKRQ